MSNEVENTGRYSRGFLNTLVGEGRYEVRSEAIRDLTEKEVYERTMAALDDPNLGFAYVSDTKVTFVTFKDYPGWMKFAPALGITIEPSTKIAKRVTVMTRLAYLHTIRRPGKDRPLKIASVSSEEFTTEDTEGMESDVVDRFLDGANVFSKELLEEMITNGSRAIENQWDKGRINRTIDRAGSFSLRVCTPSGLIKGDALCVPAESMGGFDVLYHENNIKPEFKTDFEFVLAEAHAEAGPVWTDGQTMSWLSDFVFGTEQLVEALTDMADITMDDLASNRYPKFFTDTSKLGEDTLISQFQSQALRWHQSGLGMDQSIFLQGRIGQGFINLLSSKQRWPVPCAIYAHVASDSWLAMAGFDLAPTVPGTVWFHEPTQRLVYNDKDFAALYNRHGGWDLDDSVRAIFRTMNGRKVVVVVRSPNSYGEYDVKDYVPGTFYPKWARPNGTFTEFPEVIDERPAYLEDLNITYRGLPQPPHPPHSTYTKELVREAIDTSLRSQGVFGRRANADMVYFYTFNGYRPNQLAPIEAIIDACTQEQSEEALMAIDQDTEDILNAVTYGGKVVDRALWQRRIGRLVPGVRYDELGWSQLCSTHEIVCEVYASKLIELAQNCVNNIDPDVIDLGTLYAGQGAKLVNWYYEMANAPGERVREFYLNINAAMMAVIGQLPKLQQMNLVLGMAHQCYTRKHGQRYSDTPLFQSGKPGEACIFDLYLDAIAFYKIGGTFNEFVTCNKCMISKRTSDRIEYQAYQVFGTCAQDR